MVWDGYAVLMSGKTDSITKLNNNPGCLLGSTFVYSEVFKLDFSLASTYSLVRVTIHPSSIIRKISCRIFKFTIFQSLVPLVILIMELVSNNVSSGGDDEVVLTDEDEVAEVFRIDTNIFYYETPLCSAFNEFNYLLKVDQDLLTKDIMGFKTYEDDKDDWIYEWNNDVPWVYDKPWVSAEQFTPRAQKQAIERGIWIILILGENIHDEHSQNNDHKDADNVNIHSVQDEEVVAQNFEAWNTFEAEPVNKKSSLDGKQLKNTMDENLMKKSFVNVVNGEKDFKETQFRELVHTHQLDEGIDVELPMESVLEATERYDNTLYGYFIGKRVAFPIVENYALNVCKKFGLQKCMMNTKGFFFFKFASNQGVLDVIKKGPWIKRSIPIILNKWSPNVSLTKEDLTKVPVWVKLKDVPLVGFTHDALSDIATNVGKPIMLNSYTSSMCMESWGRPSYAREMVEIPAMNYLKETITVATPSIRGWTSNGGSCDGGTRIILGWDPDVINLMAVTQDEQVLYCMARSLSIHPWVIMGDFNASLSIEDSSTGSSRFTIAMRESKGVFAPCSHSSESLVVDDTQKFFEVLLKKL
ncbi:zinc knuckle CX2CX4HX4C containing protein [Tanacetum coccineum]